MIDPFIDLPLRDTMRPGEESKVLHHRQIAIKAEALRNIAEPGAHNVPLSPGICAGDCGRAGARPDQSTEHAHGGRLTCSVRSHKPEDRAWFNLESEAAHRFELAEAFTEIA